ncbi:hypothetical protein B0H11DRAFT_2427012 [Mycena galericulata]|nr:hypothetical protein B0H11DRAFT_2427012 [Mycena galericulata]
MLHKRDEIEMQDLLAIVGVDSSFASGNLVIELVWEFKYVGIWFTSIHANVFARQCAIKASKTRGTSNTVFGLKHRIGSLPVREGLQLYLARVDCYLISGCKLAFDIDNSLLNEHFEIHNVSLSVVRAQIVFHAHCLIRGNWPTYTPPLAGARPIAVYGRT